jgi:peptidoglycan/xylan/chitin deacetylase (PgdA/CDA1 family)
MNRLFSYRWYLLILCCLLLLIGLSWSRLMSPSARSAESDRPIAIQPFMTTAPLAPAQPMNNDSSSVVAAPYPSDSSAHTSAAAEFKPERIPVLNYHSITVDPGNRAVITPAKFEAQMLYLSKNGYTTLTLQQFIDYMDNAAAAMPEKPVLLTFDDGYADNYEHAMPILKNLQFHATLFASPGTTEDGYFLNWEQIKEMHAAGWDIQPHGMTHPHLPRLTAKKQAYEITEAKRQIEENLNIKASIFCYPYGERNATTLQLLQENGFQYAFTIDQGMTTRDQDRFLLKRLFVNGEETIEQWIKRLENGSSKQK